jgi:hypothetical protein
MHETKKHVWQHAALLENSIEEVNGRAPRVLMSSCSATIPPPPPQSRSMWLAAFFSQTFLSLRFLGIQVEISSPSLRGDDNKKLRASSYKFPLRDIRIPACRTGVLVFRVGLNLCTLQYIYTVYTLLLDLLGQHRYGRKNKQFLNLKIRSDLAIFVHEIVCMNVGKFFVRICYFPRICLQALLSVSC